MFLAKIIKQGVLVGRQLPHHEHRPSVRGYCLKLSHESGNTRSFSTESTITGNLVFAIEP